MKKNETILFSKIKNLNSINQKIKKIKNPPFFTDIDIIVEYS